MEQLKTVKQKFVQLDDSTIINLDRVVSVDFRDDDGDLMATVHCDGGGKIKLDDGAARKLKQMISNL